MDFEERLNKAIQRGQKRGELAAQDSASRTLSEAEYKRLHTQHRLLISEHIERCLEQLSAHFPGFTCETVFGERGWGAAVARDDLKLGAGKRSSNYSRLEITVRPFSVNHVVELVGKGAVQNKEIFNRTVFEPIAEIAPEKFLALVDAWVLEFAEDYARRN